MISAPFVIGILVFLMVVMLVESLYLLWQESRMEQSRLIEKRVRILSAGGAHGDEVLKLVRAKELSSIAVVDRILSAMPRIHAVDRALQQTGTDITIVRFITIQLMLFVVCFVSALLFAPIPWVFSAIICTLIAIFVPIAVIKSLEKKRHRKFILQLPEALEFMTRSLRAGNPFSASLKAVAEEMPAPIGVEFGITFDEINYGLSQEDALYNLGERVAVNELRYFITAVIVQRQAGGNLADILKRLAEMMRKRERTFRDIKTQAAEMKMSANVLVALPFIVAAAVLALNPNYLMSLVKDPIGPYVFIGQGFFIVVGYLVIQRIVNFRV